MAVSSSDLLLSRRQVVGGAAALASTALLPRAYAAGDETINLALVGCGGRGSGAADQALSSVCGPTKLIAAVDVLESNLEGSLQGIQRKHKDKADVPKENRIIGYDGYKQAMDLLRPGDVVILTTPPAFRWVQFKYAIEKGLNVFMEKPVCVDAPTGRRMIELGEQAKAKNLKVGVGLMCRHCEIRGELFDRIQNGELGDLTLLRAYRMAGRTASCFTEPKPADQNELAWQVKNFHSFLWLSGGAYSDFLIHNIDEGCWMKNAWPVEAKASGGRHYRGNFIDQNFDTYSVEYTFSDGAKMYLEGRCIDGAEKEFATYAHGTKNSAVVSTAGHIPARSRIYKGQKIGDKDSLIWSGKRDEPNPYQLEWDHLLDAIRKDKPYNEVERGAMASLVTVMGRMAAHTGRIVTLEEIMSHNHEFAPDVDKLKLGGPAPLVANSEGKYPVPQPGLITKTEYAVG